MRARAHVLLWLLGIAVTVASFVVAIRGVNQIERAVSDLVRVPAGCATTVEVSRAGTYVVYVENKGRVGAIDGCGNDSRTYDSEDVPEVEVTILDRAGDVVEQTGDESIAYSTPRGVGRSVATFEADAPGRFVVEVRSTTSEAVVTVGVDVAIEKNRTVLLAAVGVLAGLLMMAIALIITVRRRRRPAGTGPMVVYGNSQDEPSLTWAPPRPQDRAPRS